MALLPAPGRRSHTAVPWWGAALLVLVLGTGAGGCGGRSGHLGAALQVERSGWDTLSVAVDFARRAPLGLRYAAQPDTVTIHVFSGTYDTLYAGGPAAAIPLPDHLLSSEEHILIEACGAFAGRAVCEQQVVTASPKRITVQPEIAYPDGGYEQGSYALRYVVERKTYDADAWELIDAAAGLSGYLLAYVEGRRAEAVRVPLSGPQGRFNLAHYQGYDDFRYHLQSALFEGREASVAFDFYAGLGGHTEQVATALKQVRAKTREEHLAEVRAFTRQAVAQVIGRLGGAGRRHAIAYIDHWRFDRFGYRYAAELEVRWWGGRFDRQRFDLEGVLEIKEDGSEVQFRRTGGNRAAERRWRERVGGSVLPLEALEGLPPELEDGAGQADEEVATADAGPSFDPAKTAPGQHP